MRKTKNDRKRTVIHSRCPQLRQKCHINEIPSQGKVAGGYGKS
jgi:hypothetical protein